MRKMLLSAAMLGGLLVPAAALAADLSGAWVVDQEAFRRSLNQAMARYLATVPKEQLEQMQANGLDPAEAFAEEDLDGDRFRVEFLEGGVLRVAPVATDEDEADEDGAEETAAEREGRWRLDGNIVHVDMPESDDVRTMEGLVAGDRIELKPVVDPADPDAARAADFVVPLVREP